MNTINQTIKGIRRHFRFMQYEEWKRAFLKLILVLCIITLVFIICAPSTVYGKANSFGSNDVIVETADSPDTKATKYAFFTDKSKSTMLARDINTVNGINDYICTHVSYDNEKAEQLVGKKVNYVPVPDEILESGKGICLDFASVTAAMFRSAGVPCKIVFGDVTFDDGSVEYHAWNEILVDGEWELVDNTIKAGNPNYVVDPANYAFEKYV